MSMSRWSMLALTLGSLSIIGTGFATGCGGTKGGSGFNGSSGGGGNGGDDGGGSSNGGGTSSGGNCGLTGCSGSSGGSSGGDATTGGCTNLQCQVHSCGGSTTGTTITGTVTDPAGRNPLYNVVVYVPNSQGGVLDTLPIGIGSNSCSCGALFSGNPITYALTDTKGNFTLTNVPDGANIPLVVQIGKWRKEITVPSVNECTSNSAGSIALPKNLTDGKYASMPNIAVSTGGADTLECLLTRVGVDESAFTGSPVGPGIHIFHGSGGNKAAGSPDAPTSLWDSQADLMRYDIVMLSCEGSPTLGVSETTAGFMAPYISAGGRVFAEHYHYAFFTGYSNGTGPAYPQFPNLANWANLGLSGNDSPYNSDIAGDVQQTLPNGKPFPEGVALKQWLGNVGALNANSEIVVPAANARDTALVTSTNVATPWVQTASSVSPPSTQYFSWDMPFNPPVSDAGVPEYCGRAVYSDMHVSGSANDYDGSQVVPTGCDATSKLSPDEDAIEFILFDLSSCITPVGFTPQPPSEGGIAQ
jgi:hypothetical protein